jgi:hypothetical protein
MRFHDREVIVDLAAALPQVTNQFFAAIELRASGLVAIEIADQANTERNVVEIIAVHMATVDLPAPAIAHFDLAVTAGGAIADDEMIGKTVSHPPDVPMIIIENRGVPLSRATVVHNNELPAGARDWRAINCVLDRAAQITVTAAAAMPPKTKQAREK